MPHNDGLVKDVRNRCAILYAQSPKIIFFSDFLKIWLWGRSDIACSGHAKKKNKRWSPSLLPSYRLLKLQNFVILYVNGEIDHDFRLKEHGDPNFFCLKHFIYMEEQPVKF